MAKFRRPSFSMKATLRRIFHRASGFNVDPVESPEQAEFHSDRHDPQTTSKVAAVTSSSSTDPKYLPPPRDPDIPISSPEPGGVFIPAEISLGKNTLQMTQVCKPYQLYSKRTFTLVNRRLTLRQHPSTEFLWTPSVLLAREEQKSLPGSGLSSTKWV